MQYRAPRRGMSTHCCAQPQCKDGLPVNSDFWCVSCSQMCLSRTGLYSHTRTHHSWWDLSHQWLNPAEVEKFVTCSCSHCRWRFLKKYSSSNKAPLSSQHVTSNCVYWRGQFDQNTGLECSPEIQICILLLLLLLVQYDWIVKCTVVSQVVVVINLQISQLDIESIFTDGRC